jgi:redox-sensitive bicupin YhaK (pirin superfamily)
MLSLRCSEDRGASRTAWLDSHHSFSFADYHDPRHMGFRALRVLNEDRIAPRSGFGAHPHRDMEILTVPIAGVLEHRDSEGGHARLAPGRVQVMTAGTGIVHSEVNPSRDETLHLLQIWLLPSRAGLAPGYRELDVDPDAGPLQPLVTPDGRGGTLRIHQDAFVYRLRLEAGASLEHALAPGRHAWLQLVRGDASLDGVRMGAGDGAALSDASALRLSALEETEGLLFDLA